jgi:benzoyl-CoA reductase/2-hydroxyglutaryl-CoA dehydratase subunit BcrC/BadD/HgdB
MMCHPLISCRPATYELLSTKNILEQRFKVPAVIIEGDIIDLRVFNEEEALSKMEAFVETMDDYRQKRKAAGMHW